MSDPSHSPQPDDPLQSGAVSGGSPPPTEETPVQPDSDAEAAAPESAVPVPDPAEENSPGEEDDDDEEGEEIDDDTPAVSSMDLRPTTDVAALPSPTGRRGESKRRKGKGKGKRKLHAKKLQAIEEKLRNLRSNLNPIPFIAHKILDFANHEKLFKKLGLWEFVHIDFDKTIRADFIAQLVANYNPKLRSSSVNGCRVGVNRADLARSLKLPVKKERGKAGGAGAEVDLDWEEVLSDESLGFVAEFVSDWVLLHEDTWMMPNEVMEWMKLIKEGHPEKVDWAGMLWFMVEKELKQGGQLKDCYYACHLQQLIKCQQGEVFLMGEEPVNAEVESGAEVMVVKDEASDGIAKESEVVEIPAEEGVGDLDVEGPSTELTLGQDGEKEEEVKDEEMVDAEKCKESDEEAVGEERVEAEHWFLNGKNNLDEHFMQRCSTENAEGFGSFEHMKDDVVDEEERNEEDELDGGEYGEEEEEEEEEEEPDNYHVPPFPNGDALEGNDFTGNYLQGVEGNQMAFTSQEQLPNHSSVDINVHNFASVPPFYNNSGKRAMDHDYHNTVFDSNKRLRVNESWENTQVDFGMCMEQIQQVAQRARMLYEEEKEQAAERSNMTHQTLLEEVNRRDRTIEQLHKAKMEEGQKKDMEILRLERELHLIGSMVRDYRKALKDVRKAFAEYRDRAQLSEESTYKDVGHGLMLTAAEIEKRRKIEEEEYRVKCFVIEQQMKEEEKGYNAHMQGFFDKVNLMNQRLSGLEADAKQLIALYSKKRIPKTVEEEEEQQQQQQEDDDDEEMHEVAETLPVPEPNEPVNEEVTEAMPSTELEEQVVEVAEDPAIPQGDDKIVEVAEPPSVE